MYSKAELFGVVLLAVLSVSCVSADVFSTVASLRTQCCASLPLLIREATVNACRIVNETKPGYFMFGGSSSKNRSCIVQCAFDAENLLKLGSDGNKTVDMTAVKLRLGVEGGLKWLEAVEEAKTNCTVNQPNVTRGSVSSKCISGANELSVCIYKTLITRCPSSEFPVNKTDCATKVSNANLSFFQRILRIFAKKNATTTTTTVAG